MYLCTRIKNTGNKSSIDKGISSVLTSKDPLAQLVEHNTFNVGVLGSNPKRITRIPAESQGTFLTKLKQEEVFTVVKSSFSV